MSPKKSKVILLSAVVAMFLVSHVALAGEDLGYVYDVPYEAPIASKQSVAGEVQQGQSFQNILNIQERLAVLGYYPTYLMDGKHRKELVMAIRRFQKDYELKEDGIFGPKTASMLNRYTGMIQMRPHTPYGVMYTPSYAPFYPPSYSPPHPSAYAPMPWHYAGH